MKRKIIKNFQYFIEDKIYGDVYTAAIFELIVGFGGIFALLILICIIFDL